MIETQFMTETQFDKLMEEMIDFTAETVAKEDAETEKLSLMRSLEKISNMLASKEFHRKCKEQAKVYDVKPSFIKNLYAIKIINAIGDSIGITIRFIGDVFNYLVRLVAHVLQNIMNFAVSALTKLVNIITSANEAII